MNAKIESYLDVDNQVHLDINSTQIVISQDDALEIIHSLKATLSHTENYLSLKPGDTVWYIDKEEQTMERGEISLISFKDEDIVDSFSVTFPDTNDFDEFLGSALGTCFFISKFKAQQELTKTGEIAYEI